MAPLAPSIPLTGQPRTEDTETWEHVPRKGPGMVRREEAPQGTGRGDPGNPMGGTTDRSGLCPWLRGWRYLGSPGPSAWLLSVRQVQVPLGHYLPPVGTAGSVPWDLTARTSPGDTRQAEGGEAAHPATLRGAAHRCHTAQEVPLSSDPAACWPATPVQSCCWTDSSNYTQRKQTKEH